MSLDSLDTSTDGFGNIIDVIPNLLMQFRGLSKPVVQGKSVCLLAMCTEVADPHS